MGLFLAAALVHVAAGDNLLANPGFESGLEPWRVSTREVAMEAAQTGGRRAARIRVPDEAAVGFPLLFQERAVEGGEVFRASVEAMGRGIRDGYGAYMSCEFRDGAGTRLSFVQTPPASVGGAWENLQCRMVVPPGAATLRVCLLLNGHGEAWFDDAVLEALPRLDARPLDGPVTLTVSAEPTAAPLIGFGAEDDGWFYNPENAAHGVTEADWAIREGRIDWMDPDYVRMFVWYKDWNPSGDWETFTFDSANMASHYRTLDQYQRLGARLNVTGVEWAMEDPYGDPARAARGIGALFEHLIRTKGYTCVRDWTLTNEPNGHFKRSGYPFERYVELHERVKEEFARRGLDVSVVGSDDTAGYSWFQQCVESDAYFQTADYFASHRYFQYPDRVFAPFFFDDRLSLLAARDPVKPLVVAEFGFQDARSDALENPLMESYPYAVWTTAFVIEGLNRGVAGFSIWCLHEVYYPGNGFMNYGLWDYKDNDWKPRPVYHAAAMFSRLTEAGDRVRPCSSSHPGHVLGAVAGDTLFWVNRGEEPAEVRVAGFAPATMCVMTEATLEGDRECGVEATYRESFTAPPMSFGYAR
ncbi:MAG: hypothetical protein JXR94_21825 [Candidatus Hydrogenedentes bacterium]|nr:hypothetical protein [Candidatus Hydrogenedentota bacterium]